MPLHVPSVRLSRYSLASRTNDFSRMFTNHIRIAHKYSCNVFTSICTSCVFFFHASFSPHFEPIIACMPTYMSVSGVMDVYIKGILVYTHIHI
jgi:hypothetical protein